MKPLWSAEELQEIFPEGQDGRSTKNFNVSGVSIDSRSLEPGDLFVALSGDPGPAFSSSVVNARDGHDFIPVALKNGAAAVLVSKEGTIDCPVLKADNTLTGLWQLGSAGRRRMSGKVVGITGSSGKTTARQCLQQILSKQGNTHASVGSLNNHWGVPLSLSRMPKNSDYGIFEIGTNHPGEIAPLSELVNPDLALVLNVLPAHIGNFKGLTDIRKEKLSISKGLKDGGNLVLPIELVPFAKEFKTISFGLTSNSCDNNSIHKNADICGEGIQNNEGTLVKANVFGQTLEYQLNTRGEHRVLTSLAVLAMVYALDADIELALQEFSQMETPEGRGNEHQVRGISIVDDSYNANPASMSFAIDALIDAPCKGRRIALLGEMLELGAQSEQSHLAVLEKSSKLDQVITVGQGFEQHSTHQDHFDTCSEIDLQSFAQGLKAGDRVLIKGSNKVFWHVGFVKQLLESLA